jgi:hypothetical protein
MRKPSTSVPLIVEPHPDNYTGYKFISMIRYNDENTINVVDNVINKSIHTYVLDLCGPAEVDEIQFIDIANGWYISGNHKNYPLSVEFSRVGWSIPSNKILRVFPLDYVTRIIGPLNEFPMAGYSRARKRKKRL